MLMGWMDVKLKSMQALNETTFFATYVVGILAEEVGTLRQLIIVLESQ